MASRPEPGSASTGELGFDPEALLDRDSHVLLDAAFLATLHAELVRDLEPEESAATLLQMGFLHGLQDALRALAVAAEVRPGAPERPLIVPLRMPWCARHAPEAPEATWIEGDWPDRQEASAHLSVFGAGTAAVCHLSAGYTSGWLTGALDADVLAVETRCSASGQDGCRFVAREASEWAALADPLARAGIAALPFTRLRELVGERLTHRAERRLANAGPPGPGAERGGPAVHVWGPVMVIPYAGPEEILQALDLLARDANASQVSVIVVDVAGAIVDEAFGALALEQLVQTCDAWGTEVVFVDPSPLSDRALDGLEHPPLLTLKDLEPAVALAFQIARSQRRMA
jgi:V4R domain